MPTWKLTVEYEGTRYHGWQSQKNADRTIQGTLIRAARELLGEDAAVGGAGRTDSGVHALAQVAHLRAKKTLTPREIEYGLNDRLPFDVNVLSVEPAPPDFHARHDAALADVPVPDLPAPDRVRQAARLVGEGPAGRGGHVRRSRAPRRPARLRRLLREPGGTRVDGRGRRPERFLKAGEKGASLPDLGVPLPVEDGAADRRHARPGRPGQSLARRARAAPPRRKTRRDGGVDGASFRTLPGNGQYPVRARPAIPRQPRAGPRTRSRGGRRGARAP